MTKKGGYKILLVDDEEDIIEFLSYNLQKEGFEVSAAFNGLEAVKKATSEKPHLIIMDVMMPEMDGIEAVKEIRKNPDLDDTLIIFLTARSDDLTQITGLESGADDYVTKPVKPKVLISRLTALLRRSTRKGQPDVIRINDLVIDREQFLVFRENKEIRLPKKEFKLLRLLASEPNKVFTREEIFSKVWGDDVIVGDRTIDVHVRKIREKTGVDYIRTVKGIGYKLEKIG
ncbi:MAG: DNA-binding response regulator [Bacteroidetes bacterium]|nr:MAG: DNA-binding response regulator [Bacteroidota bacterium]RLD49415.1 MAG: DNA-binding response regulator [Bacteroidota bacterium]RLD73579.1 MAG: DNA-binding response regulator [Bacteroidota bacterium]